MEEKKDHQRSGQTIMEMVVALSVLTIGLLGIITLLNVSLGLNRVVADNYRGTYLAAEGVEIVKSLVTTNAEKKITWCSGLPSGDYELDYRVRVPELGTYDCLAPYPGLDNAANQPLRLHATSHLYDYDRSGSVPTIFYRTVSISYEPAGPNAEDDKMIVQSVVHWKDRTGDNRVDLIDYIFNPAPTVPTTP